MGQCEMVQEVGAATRFIIMKLGLLVH
jgi:hypothetical protein